MTYYVLAKNNRDFHDLCSRLRGQPVDLVMIASVDEARAITGNNIINLQEAWLHPEYDDIVDVLESEKGFSFLGGELDIKQMVYKT